VPRPAAGPGEAIIRVTLTTICGTDVHILKGEYLLADITSTGISGAESGNVRPGDIVWCSRRDRSASAPPRARD
jgi:threonine dehydrogenase-like Zn-dependent dehydrogenase